MASLVVEPPSQTTVNRILDPPVVVRISGPETTYTVATVYLYGTATGSLIEGLNGTTTVTGVIMTKPGQQSGSGFSASAQPATYFTFADLSVPFAGSYYLLIVINAMNMQTGNLDHIAQTTTSSFQVNEEQVAREQPSERNIALLTAYELILNRILDNTERKILHELRNNGVQGVGQY